MFLGIVRSDNYLSVEVGVRAGQKMPRDVIALADDYGCYHAIITPEGKLEFRFPRISELDALRFNSSLEGFNELEGSTLLSPQDRERRTSSG